MSRITYALFTAGAIGLSAALTATLVSFPATASPGSGAGGTVVAQGTTDDPVHVQTTGATRMVFQRVTIQPNGFTGWHTHPGPLLVVVESGTLTHYDRHCNVATYHAGDAFEETPGTNAVHMGANYGAEPVVLDVTYIVPADAPLRDEADPPACASGELARS